LLYLLAAGAFAMSRLPRFEARGRVLVTVAFGCSIVGLVIHATTLHAEIYPPGGLNLSIASSLSFLGLQLALIGVLGATQPVLRGMTAGMLALAALVAVPLAFFRPPATGLGLTWQLQAHIMVAMFAYGLLSVGALVAVYALAQDSRLRSGRFSAINYLFAPLETTEKLLFGIAAAGFAGLLIAVSSGFMFVEDLFAQHLVHKTLLSLLALLLFGILVAGRMFAGWRGRRAVYLYLWGFAILCLAYFGTRFVLEILLHRSWG
jgi:ABC-type uncharacterized transport system permease subunit